MIPGGKTSATVWPPYKNQQQSNGSVPLLSPSFPLTLEISKVFGDTQRATTMTGSILKVKGDKIVDKDGNAVLLRGAGLGGWMNQVSISSVNCS